ncbi:MAG: hypothetical protein RIG68_09380 [Imperialibacter sp.]|uniref:hypothetical protein n=1 Tax=Imperialibacter sp. TaxID=2038411 RepID=UPI0032ECBFBA
MKLNQIDESHFNKEIEKALNEAINKLGVDEELVFESFVIHVKEKLKPACRKVKVCKRMKNGKVKCKWEKRCD